jgi:hypothetical protein
MRPAWATSEAKIGKNEVQVVNLGSAVSPALSPPGRVRPTRTRDERGTCGFERGRGRRPTASGTGADGEPLLAHALLQLLLAAISAGAGAEPPPRRTT